MNEPGWPERYYLGLDKIKAAIHEALSAAGARLSDDCIFHPRLPSLHLEPPKRLSIVAVPLNGPRIAIEFERQEVADFGGPGATEAAAKVQGYVTAFRNFRNGEDRNVRARRNGSAGAGLTSA